MFQFQHRGLESRKETFKIKEELKYQFFLELDKQFNSYPVIDDVTHLSVKAFHKAIKEWVFHTSDKELNERYYINKIDGFNFEYIKFYLFYDTLENGANDIFVLKMQSLKRIEFIEEGFRYHNYNITLTIAGNNKNYLNMGIFNDEKIQKRNQ